MSYEGMWDILYSRRLAYANLANACGAGSNDTATCDDLALGSLSCRDLSPDVRGRNR